MCWPLLSMLLDAAGWLSSRFQRKRNRFLGKYRFWVEPASPPEDYIYENLSVPLVSCYIRMVSLTKRLCLGPLC
jgi:hypothetical protein